MRKKNKPTLKQWLLIALCAFLGLGFGGSLGVFTGMSLSNNTEEQPETPAWNGFRNPVNILVMGTDVSGSNRNPGLTGNTDTMILMNLNPSTQKVKGVSIPRDTRVYIPGHRVFKINAANPYGGPELAMKTVSQTLMVPIHRYILINTRGLIEAIDAIGGVMVTIPKDVRYNDNYGGLHINFKKGAYHLNGKQVQEYLRFRHDEWGDIGRVQRQQGFLLEIMDQFLQPSVLPKIPTLLQIVQHNSKTNLSPMEILQLVNFGKSIKGSENCQLVMLPGKPQNIDGLSYWIANFDPVQQYLDDNFRIGVAKLATASETPLVPKVTIYDATPQGGKIRNAKRLIEAGGFEVRNYDRVAQQAHTQVIVERGDIEGANRLISTLGMGEKVEASLGDFNSDFTVILGADWVQPQTTPTPR